jgi:hypothetical protein
MGSTGIEITGGGNLAALGPLFAREAMALIAETVLFAEVAIADQIDAMHAVDTGRLKASISAKTAFNSKDTATAIDSDGLGAVVGTNIAYAIPVHEGYTRTLRFDTKVKAIKLKKNGELTKESLRRGYSFHEKTGAPVLTVAGRPYVRAAVPDIEAFFQKRARERFGTLV